MKMLDDIARLNRNGLCRCKKPLCDFIPSNIEHVAQGQYKITFGEMIAECMRCRGYVRG